MGAHPLKLCLLATRGTQERLSHRHMPHGARPVQITIRLFQDKIQRLNTIIDGPRWMARLVFHPMIVVKRCTLPLHDYLTIDHVDAIPCALRGGAAPLQVKVSVVGSLVACCSGNAVSLGDELTEKRNEFSPDVHRHGEISL